MKTPGYFSMILLLLTFFACSKEGTENKDSSLVNLVNDPSVYAAVAADRSSLTSDPFDLKGITQKGDSVEITVAYSGGCKQHSFEVIWNGAVAENNPPEINLFIKHHANGDVCEGYITEKLIISLTNLTESITYPNATFNVMNGGNISDSVAYKGNVTEIRFAESDTCNVLVTASSAICGNGLYGNLWFALDDSIRAGAVNYYFHKYLQPVSINSNIKGFVPVAGKRYRIGARIDRGNYFTDVVMCLAYSGPSVPVKIMCIREIN
jgi:hypothetical protein